MMRHGFIPCLNKQKRIYNYTPGALIVGGICLVLFGFGKGMLYGLAMGAVGFSFGNYLSNSLYYGHLQRTLYRYLPLAREWLDRNIPASSNQHEL